MNSDRLAYVERWIVAPPKAFLIPNHVQFTSRKNVNP